jgi:hypothetical protein
MAEVSSHSGTPYILETPWQSAASASCLSAMDLLPGRVMVALKWGDSLGIKKGAATMVAQQVDYVSVMSISKYYAPKQKAA